MPDIKQIKIGNTNYDIDAKKWNGHTFSEITDLVHGVVDTYVIPITKSSTTGYSEVVESTKTQVTTTVSKLKGLVTNSPDDKFDEFGIGDIILMGATSDGSKNFDRWISNISGTGDGATITLDVLETQVATHHHTFNTPVVEISTKPSSKALTGVSVETKTSSTMAKVGTTVGSILTGAAGNVITSVKYSGDGSYDLKLATGTAAASDYGHSHTVNSHTHSVTFKPSSYVSRSIEAYTTLTSAEYTPHTHSSTTVAGTPQTDTTLTYVTGVSQSATFIKTLKDSSETTGNNTAGLTTNDITSDTLTSSSGSHSHSVSATTSESFVKTVTLAGNVITSVVLNYTAPTVKANVVTSITKEQKTAVTSATLTGQKTFVSTWSASVDANGVLSFNVTTNSVSISAPTTIISAINTITSGGQSAGSATLSKSSYIQSYTSSIVTATCNTGSAGDHQHGFSHTHTIPSHTHSYNKSVKSTDGSAIISLTSTTYSTHKHGTNVTVINAATDGSKFKYLKGGSKTSVVRDLVNTDISIASTSTSTGTSTAYIKISGTITHPGLTVTSRALGITSITPAVNSGETPIKSITFTSSNFLTDVTLTTSTREDKTSTNKGGKPS